MFNRELGYDEGCDAHFKSAVFLFGRTLRVSFTPLKHIRFAKGLVTLVVALRPDNPTLEMPLTTEELKGLDESLAQISISVAKPMSVTFF